MPRKSKGGEGAEVQVQHHEAQPQQPQGGGRSKPAHEVRAGRIKATCWLNEDKDGRPWYSVTVTRSYKDGEGNWKQATSFGRDDLLVVAECARLAWLFCSQQSANGSNGNGHSNSGEVKADEDIPF